MFILFKGLLLMINEALKQKFLLRLIEDIHELKTFQKEISQKKYDDICLLNTSSMLHKMAGLCLTFNFKEEGAMARYIEMRLQKISETKDFQSLENISEPISTLIETCEEHIKVLKCSFKNNSPLNKAMEDMPFLTHQGKQLHIFIVDDDPIILTIMKQQFLAKNIKVTPFESGVEVLKYTSLNTPDLIILDQNMPHMNGSEVCEKLFEKESTKHIPIFLLSASSTKELKNIHTLKNIKKVFEKPFDVEATLEILKLYI